MSGSPNTVNRLPAPVFFNSSPITRSAFIRTSSTGTRPEAALRRDVREALLRGHVLLVGAEHGRVEGERQHAQQVQVAGPVRLPGGLLDERRADRAVLRPDRDADPLRPAVGYLVAVADGLDVG